MIFKALCFFGVLQIAMVLSFDLPRNPGNCSTNNTFKIDDEYFSLSRIIDIGDATPTNLQYDVYGNLFFILLTKYENGSISYDAYVLKPNADAPVKIDGLPKGACYCTALDFTYDDVYFGTSKGIFRYEYESTNATRDSGLCSDILPNMLIIDKDGNKYVSENNNGIEQLFLLEGDRKTLYKTIQGFNEIAIDSDNSMYFIKDNGLFSLKPNEIIARHILDVSYRGIAQMNFYKDMVFMAAGEVTYFHKNSTNSFNRLGVSYNGVALAFSKGNFMLGTRGKLLQYDKFDCVSYIRTK